LKTISPDPCGASERIESLTQEFQRLEHGLDESVAEREGLKPVLVGRVVRHVVGHEHAFIVNLAQGSCHLDHVHVPLVWKDLSKIVSAAADVPEVYVEDLLLCAKVADDVVDLACRILEHLGHSAQAEV